MATVTPPATTQQTTETQSRPAGGGKLSRYLPLYLAISPFYILFAVFGLFPIAFSVFLSFQNWNGIGEMEFVGLAQYKYLLTDSDFLWSIINTFIIWVLSTVPMLFFALVIAFLLNSKIRLRGFYRVAYFVPNITSLVALAIIFGSIFANNFGLLNAGLNSLGLDSIGWLNNPWGIRIVVAAMVIWRWTGYNAIIYLAGLQSISSDIYEAARVDGASDLQIFLRITIPMLRPVILFTVITSTVGGLQIFTESQILVGDDGGAGNGGRTMVLYLYEQAFVKNQFGYGAAIGWGLFAILVVFSIINWRLVQRAGTGRARTGDAE